MLERELDTPGVPAALQFSPDGSRLATAELDGTARVFDVGTGAVTNHLRPERKANAVSLAFAPTGDALIVGTNRNVHVFDLRTNARVRQLGSGALYLAMAPDGVLLATAPYDGWVTLWDWRTGTPVREIAADHGTGLRCGRRYPSDRRPCSGSACSMWRRGCYPTRPPR